MKATIRLKLHMSPASEAALHETMRQFTACFNAVCCQGWDTGERNGVRLHHATYPDLRERYDHLPSQLVVSSHMKATEALKSVEERSKKGRKVSCPQSLLSSISPLSHPLRCSFVLDHALLRHCFSRHRLRQSFCDFLSACLLPSVCRLETLLGGSMPAQRRFLPPCGGRGRSSGTPL